MAATRRGGRQLPRQQRGAHHRRQVLRRRHRHIVPPSHPGHYVSVVLQAKSPRHLVPTDIAFRVIGCRLIQEARFLNAYPV